MRKNIVRTMVTSKISAYMLSIDNGIPKIDNLEPLFVMGKATEKDALKGLRDKYGKHAPVQIASIEYEENTYKISVEDFLKYAVLVPKDSEPCDEESEDSETEEKEN